MSDGATPPEDARRGAPETRASSARDPRVVRAARLLRDEAFRRAERAFVVDSAPLLAEARAAGIAVESVLTGGEDALRALAFAGQPPEVAAVCRMPDEPPDGLPASSLVLARVDDPANVGAILRTAAALGVPRVTLTPGSADPWSRRALRTALGASFASGLVATERPLHRLTSLPGRPPLAAAVPRGGVPPHELPDGAVVVLGSEATGLSEAERGCCDLAVTIPAPGFESLNVAAAAAIFGWVLTRRPGA